MNTLVEVGTALVFAAFVGGVGGCAPRAAPRSIDAELAQLREEERALRQEMAALRAEISRLSSALESTEPAETEPPTSWRAQQREQTSPLATGRSQETPAIVTVLDSYRQALESEDLPRLEQLYGGALPTDDQHYVEVWFARADELRIDMHPRTIEVLNGNARAVVSQVMTYRLDRTDEVRSVELKVRIYLERRGGDWRLARVEAHL